MLQKRLPEAASNSFSPAWRQIIEELGIAGVVGNALNQRLRDVFERNQITPAAALTEIKEICNEVAQAKTACLKPVYAQRMRYAINGLTLRRNAKSTTIEHSG